MLVTEEAAAGAPAAAFPPLAPEGASPPVLTSVLLPSAKHPLPEPTEVHEEPAGMDRGGDQQWWITSSWPPSGLLHFFSKTTQSTDAPEKAAEDVLS